MMLDINRRRFLGFLAAPAIVRASSLMTVKPLPFAPAWEDVFGKPLLDCWGAYLNMPRDLGEIDALYKNRMMAALRLVGPCGIEPHPIA